MAFLNMVKQGPEGSVVDPEKPIVLPEKMPEPDEVPEPEADPGREGEPEPEEEPQPVGTTTA
jgi:hypothetical protein